MKICAIICEYNPFHNGHLYQIQQAKAFSGADAILCLMSGNFVQRGEAAVMDKYTRAKHAILAGADVVAELPTVFATSNAELFAKGAISILSKLPCVSTLCFGVENADATTLYSAANLLNNEPKEISDKIKEQVSSGIAYAKARANAWENFLSKELLTSPNNILGLEYTRAILESNAKIEILPIQRQGAGYLDDKIYQNFSSASAIRKGIAIGESIEGNLPKYTANDLPDKLETTLDSLEKYAILNKSSTEIAAVCDCTEGLENAFKKAALLPQSLTSTLTSARYTSARIRRIALQNLLNLPEELIRECLKTVLYLRVLGARKARTDVLSALADGATPLLIRAHDENSLFATAKACYERDIFAEKVYSILYPLKSNKIFFE